MFRGTVVSIAHTMDRIVRSEHVRFNGSCGYMLGHALTSSTIHCPAVHTVNWPPLRMCGHTPAGYLRIHGDGSVSREFLNLTLSLLIAMEQTTCEMPAIFLASAVLQSYAEVVARLNTSEVIVTTSCTCIVQQKNWLAHAKANFIN